MKRAMRWHDYITINVYWFALTTRSQVVTALVVPLLLAVAYVTYAELMKQVGYSTAFLGKWHLGMDEYIPENQGFDFVIGGREQQYHTHYRPLGYRQRTGRQGNSQSQSTST